MAKKVTREMGVARKAIIHSTSWDKSAVAEMGTQGT